jgi:hypothetical protein
MPKYTEHQESHRRTGPGKTAATQPKTVDHLMINLLLPNLQWNTDHTRLEGEVAITRSSFKGIQLQESSLRDIFDRFGVHRVDITNIAATIDENEQRPAPPRLKISLTAEQVHQLEQKLQTSPVDLESTPRR